VGRDFREALVATCLLGILIGGLYRLIMGDLPWSFIVGELIGLFIGMSLLVITSPRRRL
jgi:F0F1-type ATP synthase assembly protein I